MHFFNVGCLVSTVFSSIACCSVQTKWVHFFSFFLEVGAQCAPEFSIHEDVQFSFLLSVPNRRQICLNTPSTRTEPKTMIEKFMRTPEIFTNEKKKVSPQTEKTIRTKS